MPPTLQELESRLQEAEELLSAIRSGEVDALVVPGPRGDQIYTLRGAEHPYRALVEAMSEGAVIVAGDGTIFYANGSFAAMLATPLDAVIGAAIEGFVLPDDRSRYATLFHRADGDTSRDEIRFTATNGSVVPAYVSISAFETGTSTGVCMVVTDLTAHKRHQDLISAEALERTKLAEAEAGQRRLTSVLESITDSFLSIDRNWRVTDVNHRAAANLGTTRDELIGRVFWDVSPPGRIPDLDEQYRRAMADRVAVHFEAASAAAPDKWFERHVYPTDEGLAVYFRDITRRKQAEEALRAANDRLAMILDSITDRFFAFDDQWRFTYLNKQAADQIRALDRDPAALIGKVTWDEIQADPEVEAVFRRAQSERTALTHEVFYPPLKEWVENRIYPSADGSVVVFQRYITERKRAEAELRRSEALLAEGQRMSHTGSWTFDVITQRLSWSLEHFRIFGVDPDTFELTLETALQLIHPEDRLSANQTFERSIDERSDFNCRLRIVRPDGTIRHVHSRAHPSFSESGGVTEYIGTVVDITERVEVEKERAQLVRQVVQAQEDERRRIALEMHDEFGQQLSALALKLSALRRAAGRRVNLSQQLAASEAIVKQLDRDLEHIIWRLRPTTLDDLGLTAALSQYVKWWSDYFEINADLHARGFEPHRLTSDIDTALYRITQEALNNVAKHAQAKNVAILLDGRLDRASVIIEDDGIGFDTGAAGPGRRFGVAGMRERAALLGGTLDIESHAGQGTTVVARIPLPSSPPRSGE